MLLTGGRSAAAPSNLWVTRRGKGGGGRNWRPWETSPPPGPAEALRQPSRTSSGSSSCDSPPRPAQPGPAIDNCQHGGRGIVRRESTCSGAPGYPARELRGTPHSATSSQAGCIFACPVQLAGQKLCIVVRAKRNWRRKAGRGRAAEAKGEQRPSIVTGNYRERRNLRAQCSSLSRSFCILRLPSGVLAIPASLVSSANLMCSPSIPSSKSLMKMLKSIGPKTEPWGTPLK
ncbi:uncharacterized protein LOC131193618 [Ahaetulla prasina]|uniref:uncharacterized protein LOC131193618 n=1 Tax=Ahaetulla prasina TaxID=499056 RepID=UPI002647ADBE|nr:uncharacterized protein LOC131193618 [Ahaetulla prasina]